MRFSALPRDIRIRSRRVEIVCHSLSLWGGRQKVPRPLRASCGFSGQWRHRKPRSCWVSNVVHAPGSAGGHPWAGGSFGQHPATCRSEATPFTAFASLDIACFSAFFEEALSLLLGPSAATY